MLSFIRVSLCVFGALCGPALLGFESERERLIHTIDSTLDVIYSEPGASLGEDDQQAAIRSVLEASYDMNVIIRRTIGRNWKSMQPEEQERVLELTKKLVIKAYIEGLEGLSRPEIKYGEVVEVTDKRIEIDSEVRAGSNVYHVQYRLAKLSSGWQIYDIVAENISVVSNYREQIDDHFRKGDAAGLIQRLEELLKETTLNENTHL